MINRFWFLAYNLILLPTLVVVVNFLAIYKKNIRENLEKRSGQWKRMAYAISFREWQKPLVWLHVASAGEFLQAQPVIEKCVKEGAECLLTYSSINAYRWIERSQDDKNSGLLLTEFLPLDTIWNARRLIGLFQPSRIVWVSYDLWPNLIWEAHRQKIPQSLISAIVHHNSLRTNNLLGRSFYKSIYKCMEHILTVSDTDRQRIITAIPEHHKVEVMGDTRCDSVLERRNSIEIPKLPKTLENRFVFVAGSTWKSDEKCIFPALKEAIHEFPDLLLIIAPHEPSEKNLIFSEKYFDNIPLLRWSKISTGPKKDTRIILIDRVGILAGLYQLANISYVGGAFTTGVHNILEPIAMGAAVTFGPKHSNSIEAIQLIEKKLVKTVKNTLEFRRLLFHYLKNRDSCNELGQKSKLFIESQAGATELSVPLLIKDLL